MSCPCGANQNFEQCCEPFISGKAQPETAEQLMRSRYTAYVKADVGYIKKTLAPESQKDFDVSASREWAEQSQWKSLKIISKDKGTAADKKGVVEFVATFVQDGEEIEHHETSQFRKNEKGQWLFVDGEAHTHKAGEGHHHHHKQETVVRQAPKIGRNDPCPCGSGKKFKKCCGVEA